MPDRHRPESRSGVLVAESTVSKGSPRRRLVRWLLKERVEEPKGPGTKAGPHQHPWWKVVCLTGVDYFSTLGYIPGIAALAAGALSPIATLLIVLLTLFGALPMYHRVAKESPHGQGSIAMLEDLLSFWRGKLFVLVLLGFVATGWLVTITLSAADATAHVVENPLVPSSFEGREVIITLVLLALLGAVFLKGFKEAIGIAVLVVAIYLIVNLIVVAVGLYEMATSPQFVADWQRALFANYVDPMAIAFASLIVFPQLALGLSGFETGVGMMPLVRGEAGDSAEQPTGRIRNTKKMLTTAALIMSFYLITTSLVTAVLIPSEEFQEGGEANGRALAYLAYEYLGDTFGTIYDLSTISILWFAGASAMAGLLNIVPRYLPRYGMASDSFAVSLVSWRRGSRGRAFAFGLVALVFVYALIANEIQRPDGIVISLLFIGAIVVTSLISRVSRSTEVRHERIEIDETAQRFIDEAAATPGELHIVANRRQAGDEREYRLKEREQREDNHIPPGEPILILEVDVDDPSEFEDVLEVRGVEVGGYRVIRLQSSVVPNAIAAFLLYVRDTTGKRPHCYFGWTEGNPIVYLIRYILFGEGDTAPVTREVLREAEPVPKRRPAIHVGG